MSEKFQETVTVVSQKQIGTGIYDLTIQTKEIAAAAKAGQFVSVYSNDASKLLPRPISLCGIDRKAGTLRLVYRVTGEHTGTEEFSRLQAGDTMKIMGPLGNGFTVEKGRKAFLIGGGIGVPPMLQLAKEMKDAGENFQIVMGYRDAGTVLDAIRENHLDADVIYACGPTPMLRALKAYAEEQNMTCYVSMEERMACGIGACLACVCNSTEKDAHSNVKNKRICKEGPVFNAKEVEL